MDPTCKVKWLQISYMIISEKHSSLLLTTKKSLTRFEPEKLTGRSGLKEAVRIEDWVQCYKTFYGRNLSKFVKSYSVRPF
jgi:hypothetical protein